MGEIAGESMPPFGVKTHRTVDPHAGLEQALESLAQLVPLTEKNTAAAGRRIASETAAPRPDAGQRIDALAEARYRTLIEQIPAVTFLASLAGGTNDIYVSPQIEALLGFTQEEWISDPVLWYRQTHPADRERVSLAFAASCATGQPFRDVIRVLARNGETVWVHAEARLVRDEEGQPLFLQGVGFDVTEHHRAQETREQLIREQAARAEADRERDRRDQFLAAAAHDLKTPLTAIKGFIQVLERRTARNSEVPADVLGETLTQVGRSANKMAKLIDQLLDITRMQMDSQLTLSKQRVELNRLSAQAVEDHGGISDRHELVFEPSPTEIWAFCDSARIERVVSNLLTNAVKYSPQGGRVIIRLKHAERPLSPAATLEVQDEGMGIPADELLHIFDRFHRGANVVGRLAGTGIGLAYVRQVIEEHGGTVEVRSDEGSGSTFTVHLPLGDVGQ